MQQSVSSSWVVNPRFPSWGFESPSPDLVKIVVDRRTHVAESQLPSSKPPIGLSQRSGNVVFPTSQAKPPPVGERWPPPLTHKENKRPGSSREYDITPFGEGVKDLQSEYFGGPLFNRTTSGWRNTLSVRSNGDVIGAKENRVPLPPNAALVMRSTGVMTGFFNNASAQSCFWVGPRLLLSTLHFNKWTHTDPTTYECDGFLQNAIPLHVETEISTKLLGKLSPTVRLISFSVENDIGLFKLDDTFPDRQDYIDYHWLIERDELVQQDIAPRTKATCVGFSSEIAEAEAIDIGREVMQDLNRQIPQAAVSLPIINFDNITKPGMKSAAPGTVDRADAGVNSVLLGVSSSLWKGSSSGPCICLEGNLAGIILGLVRGYEQYSDPYNLINGFPNGLRNHIQSLLEVPN